MKKFAIEIKWGLIISVAQLLWMLLEKQLGYHDEKIKWHMLFSLLFIFPLFLIYYFALYNKKKAYYNNEMTWMQGVTTSIGIAVVVALLSPFSQFISYEIVSPSYFENMVNYMVSTNKFTMETAQNNFNLSSAIWQNISSGLSSGLVVGALIAYFLRTKKTDINQTNTNN
jgi:membrane-associated HD superfamily phosphohydrolase